MVKLKKEPLAADKRVGSRIRQARMMAVWSQEKLGDYLDLTFQQVQKYEKGTNRVSASRLVQISAAFGHPVEWFFEGVTAQDAGLPLAVGEVDPIVELSQSPAGIALARAFRDISNTTVRRLLVEIADEFAESYRGKLVERKKSA